MRGEYKHLYNDPRWEGLRRATFRRDNYTCVRCGALCIGRKRGKRSPACDHITAHRGNTSLFFDPSNLQTLCNQCHSTGKQIEERRGYSIETDGDGWPVDPRHPANTPQRL